MSSPRDTAFVPLITAPPSAGPRADYRVTVLSHAENTQPLRAPGRPTDPCAAKADGAAHPTVSVQREGDRVSSIRVQCSCGQIIELGCVYEAANPSAAR